MGPLRWGASLGLPNRPAVLLKIWHYWWDFDAVFHGHKTNTSPGRQANVYVSALFPDLQRIRPVYTVSVLKRRGNGTKVSTGQMTEMRRDPS